MGANTKIETLWDVTKHNGNLAVFCRCGHSSVVDAALLSRWYAAHCFDIKWHLIGDHLRCSQCKGRPERIRLTHQIPTAPTRFPRDEEGWKRLVKRLRG